jgi:acyl-CoA synthetase (NDP forming)
MERSSNFEALKTLFHPRNVAVVGVSEDPIKRGRQVLRNVVSGGFAGRIYGIGRRVKEADGVRCYPSLKSVDEPVEIAFLAVPADAVSKTLIECRQAGVKVAIIGASGFAEGVDQAGVARQAELSRVANELGIRIVGPNCNGVYNANIGLALGFNAAHSVRLQAGSIAILSHSGALFSVMAGCLARLKVGISIFVSAGNEVDFDILDYLEYALEDSETRVVALLVDSLSDGQRLRRLGERACQLNKRIVALKVGVSQIGAKAALAHSSRLAGSAAAYSALFEASGVATVSTIEGLMTTAAILSLFGRASGGLGIFTTSGAGASMLADIAAKHDVPLPELQPETYTSLERIGRFSEIGNPIDLGTFDRGRSADAPLLIAADPGLGAFMTLINPIDPNSGVPTLTDDLARAKQSSEKPFVLVVPGDLPPDQAVNYEANGFRVFPDTESTIEAFGALLAAPREAAAGTSPNGAALKTSVAVSSLLSAGRPLSEPESLSILEEFGIDVVQTSTCSSLDDAVAAAERIGWPVVVKAVVDGVAHKTELGYVKIDLRNPDALRKAYAAFGSPPKVVVQPFVKAKLETIAGLTWAPDTGMILLAGLGGIYAEALRDIVMWSVPTSEEDLSRKLANSALGRVLASPRWDSPRAAAGLIQALLRLQAFAQFASPHIKAVDINPLILTDERAVAVDALIVLRNQ